MSNRIRIKTVEPTAARAGSEKVESYAEALLESDRVYFELGAEVEEMGGAAIAHMTGLTQLASGCLVHRVDRGWSEADAGRRLDLIEGRLRSLGSREPRIYLSHDEPALEALLRVRGYRSGVEVGVIALADGKREPSAVRLHRLTGEADWRVKRELHGSSAMSPDGHDSDPHAWVELERRKCASGGMIPYLIESGGEICGAVSAIVFCGLRRMKNLVIHPDHRKHGLACATAMAMLDEAEREGQGVMGCFALADGPAHRAYLHAGLHVITQQVEWRLETR